MAMVPVGTLTTTLGVGLGAVSIVHMAAAGNGHGLPPSGGGPGQWVEDKSTMSEQARAYQAQVTGAPKGRAYKVCRNSKCVEFDGYDPKDGVLLEAKGVGYDQWFTADLKPKKYFQGLDALRTQAQKQARLARGLRIRWYVAEPRMVAILKRLFEEWDVGIEVEHIPPVR
jgi:hypothetical protein